MIETIGAFFMNLFEGFYLVDVLGRNGRPFSVKFNTQGVFPRPQILYCIVKNISMHILNKVC